MNEKSIFSMIAALMIPLMATMILPVTAWSYGNPAKADDLLYEKFGPRADRLLIKLYTSPQAEWDTGLETGQIDVTDRPLDLEHYWRYTTPPWDNTVKVCGYGAEFGICLFDLNNNNNQYLGNPPNPWYPNPIYPNPMSTVTLRKACAYLSNRGKYVAFIGATTVTAIYTVVGSSYGKYSHPEIKPGGALEDLCYLYDPAAANDTLDAGGFPLGLDGWRYWDRNSNGFKDAGEAFNLKLIARVDDPNRAFAGTDLSVELTACRVPNTLTLMPSGAARTQVIANKNFHIYTGCWSLPVDPDYLILWNWDFYWHPGIWYNYDSCNDPDFNDASYGVMYANDQAEVVAYAHAAQIAYATAVLSVPLWEYTGFKAVKRAYTGPSPSEPLAIASYDKPTTVYLTAQECTAQTEGYYVVEPSEEIASEFWGYPVALISHDETKSQTFLYDSSLIWNGRSVKAVYWIQIDWDSDGNWDDIYYWPQNVTFTWGQGWSKTYYPAGGLVDAMQSKYVVLQQPQSSSGEEIYVGDYWEGFVNMGGYGVDNGYTFMNMHPEGHEFGNDAGGVADSNMTIRYGKVGQEFPSFNPVYASTTLETDVLDLIYECGFDLLHRDPYNLGQFEPWGALQYSVSTYSHPAYGTCTKVVFTLRPGEWSDGTPITLADIFFTFVEMDDILLGRGLPPPWWYSNVMNILSFSQLDPLNFEVLLDVKSIFAVSWIGENIILPKHIWKPICTTGDPTIFAPDPNLINSGAWRLEEYVANSYVLLTANSPDKTVDNNLAGSTPVTSVEGYFRWTPIIVEVARAGFRYKVVPPIGDVTVTLRNEMQTDIADANGTIRVTYPDASTLDIAFGPVTVPAAGTYAITVPGLPGYGRFRIHVDVDWPCWWGGRRRTCPITGHTYKWHWCRTVFWATIPEDIAGSTWYDDVGLSTYVYKNELVTPDFKVDIKDVVRASGAFGTYPGMYKWNTVADITGDYKVDIKDLARISAKFGWHP